MGAIACMGTAGCLFSERQQNPQFTLRNIRSYIADEGMALVVGVVEKQEGRRGEVTVRAELLIDEAYDHVSTQTFVVPADLTERTIALPFTTSSPFYGEQEFTSRAKIVRHGEPDGQWVAERE
ncbi:hypothetical protein [Natronobacterium haloterrestre]|uniref:hypothetical protein n=1 Tax=Natronobacterium haloterrestre TaxID=148448 RepID=UPI00116022FB|nr:hypothetical protein [Halobiforma haloterrestris]